MVDRLHICQTCARDGERQDDGNTRGQNLTARVLDLIAGSSLRGNLVIRKVPCLSGCPSPCNASFRAPGKLGLRFSRLGAEDAGALLEFARHYVNSEYGVVDQALWPESLAGRLTAEIPPPGL